MTLAPQPNLMLGDCLQRMAEIPDASVNLIVCDLPYGTTANKKTWDCVIPMDQLWAAWKRLLKPGAAVVLFGQSPFSHMIAMSNLPQLRTEWTWVKTSATGHLNAAKYPLKAHENILVFCDGTPPYHPQMTTGAKPYIVKRGKPASTNYGSQDKETITVSDGSRFPTTVLTFPKDHPRLHPTQKPLALLEYLICTYSNSGDMILDATMGSGSTIVAALNTGRNAIGIERDPAYFAIATERVNAATAPLQEVPLAA